MPCWLYRWRRAPGERPWHASDAVDDALAYVRTHHAEHGVEAEEVADVVVTDAYRSAHTGVAHVYLRQRLDGLEVVGADMTVNLRSRVAKCPAVQSKQRVLDGDLDSGVIAHEYGHGISPASSTVAMPSSPRTRRSRAARTSA